VALQFEMIRGVFQNTFPRARVDPAQPPIILAVKDEGSLKALLPAFWEQKGRVHPAGYFLGGQEKQYVALRTDTSVDPQSYSPNYNPYQTLYHEYIHLLVNLNYRWLPPWLNEGLAEFYGNTKIAEEQIDLGRPIEAHVELLRRQRCMPLSGLFAVDRASPYYNEESKATIFYAESWALTHLLMLGDQRKYSQKLNTYIALLNNDAKPADAATQAFGDLKELEKRLDLYLSGLTMPIVRVKQAVDIVEDDFPVRELSPAESATVRGDFHVCNHRLTEGRALLEEALRLDPNFAHAHESMGFLYFREGKKKEAAKFFDQAMKLDSRNYLAHYFHAMLTIEQNPGGEVPEGVVSDLKRTIELNPNFASAYLSLASIMGVRGQNLEEARRLALKATDLEPANMQGHLILANVMLRQERTEEAVVICRRVLAAAKTPQERASAELLIKNAQQYMDYKEEVKCRSEQARAARAAEAEADKKRQEKEVTESQPPSPPDSPGKRSAGRTPNERGEAPFQGARATAEGIIETVACKSVSLKMALVLRSYSLELRSPNYHHIDFLAQGWTPPDPFLPCEHIKGMKAKVVYTAGGSDAGEIVSIELRK
jgi:tetratricopeptide (TPR) repeat protein